MIKYVAPPETSGGTYSISLDNNYSQHPVIPGEKNTSVVTDELGMYHLPAGIHDLKISPLSFGKTELMKLLEVQLIPVASKQNTTTKNFCRCRTTNEINVS